MPLLRILALLLCVTTLAVAETDPAALQKQQQDIDRRERRDQQKIDQAEEQERIKLRSRERDELARVQRENTALVGATITAATAGGKALLLDPDKVAQAKFDEDEVHNLINNQLGADITNRFNKQRSAVTRQYTLERAKLDAQQIDGGDDTAKQRDQATKVAELNDKFQAKLDDLAYDAAVDEAKLRFSNTTKINEAEKALTALMTKHLVEQSQKGNAAVYNPTADPQYAKLCASRDEAKNALDTAIEESRAKFSAQRTDIENAKEDELAKLNG